MSWRRRQNAKSINLDWEERDHLHKQFEKLNTPPVCSYDSNWETYAYWQKHSKPPVRYNNLMKDLNEAHKNIQNFLDGMTQEKIDRLKAEAKIIEQFEEDLKHWIIERDKFVMKQHEEQVLRDDAEYTARTGKCCGNGKDWVPRTCSRRATKGNFCFQHVKIVKEFRRPKECHT